MEKDKAAPQIGKRKRKTFTYGYSTDGKHLLCDPGKNGASSSEPNAEENLSKVFKKAEKKLKKILHKTSCIADYRREHFEETDNGVKLRLYRFGDQKLQNPFEELTQLITNKTDVIQCLKAKISIFNQALVSAAKLDLENQEHRLETLVAKMGWEYHSTYENNYRRITLKVKPNEDVPLLKNGTFEFPSNITANTPEAANYLTVLEAKEKGIHLVLEANFSAGIRTHEVRNAVHTIDHKISVERQEQGSIRVIDPLYGDELVFKSDHRNLKVREAQAGKQLFDCYFRGERKSERFMWNPQGMLNLNNQSCYLLSILQCLFSLEEFIATFVEKKVVVEAGFRLEYDALRKNKINEGLEGEHKERSKLNYVAPLPYLFLKVYKNAIKTSEKNKVTAPDMNSPKERSLNFGDIYTINDFTLLKSQSSSYKKSGFKDLGAFMETLSDYNEDLRELHKGYPGFEIDLLKALNESFEDLIGDNWCQKAFYFEGEVLERCLTCGSSSALNKISTWIVTPHIKHYVKMRYTAPQVLPLSMNELFRRSVLEKRCDCVCNTKHLEVTFANNPPEFLLVRLIPSGHIDTEKCIRYIDGYQQSQSITLYDKRSQRSISYTFKSMVVHRKIFRTDLQRRKSDIERRIIDEDLGWHESVDEDMRKRMEKSCKLFSEHALAVIYWKGQYYRISDGDVKKASAFCIEFSQHGILYFFKKCI